MTVKWRERLDSLQLNSLAEMFGVDKPIISMVHLWPLPGALGYDSYGGMEAIIERALQDAKVLVEGGVNGLIVENMWDLPYYVGKETLPEAMTAQAVAAHEVKKAVKVPVGINVVHNGGRVTLSIAVAAGADFVRICLLTGARVWDTGEFDHGCAAELLRVRKNLGAEQVKIFADVDKKHSVPFPGIDLATHIEWTEYYLADALIVSGKMTGDAPELDKVRRAKELARRPVLLGSGTTAENITEFLRYADGAIVGSSLKLDGIAENPVDGERVKRYMEAVRTMRKER
ncbi:MAG TPA: BtpA/SgcQ family protein [Candidatus Fraserbacteria bacterium]|nr:BtpA/SgcQ family protein [Candidatus Fraserbacteria bacterium]